MKKKLFTCVSCGKLTSSTNPDIAESKLCKECRIRPKTESEIIPNVAKSIDGKWYPLKSKFKIEKIDRDVDVDDTYSGKKYKITIKFPTKFRTGIYPKQLALEGIKEKWGCYYYGFSESEISKEMKILAGKVKDLQRQNKILKERNWALERHFTKTFFDKDQEIQKREKTREECSLCLGEIDLKKEIEGRDFIWNDGEAMHLKCASEDFTYTCKKCGTLFLELEEDGCSECGGKIIPISKEEVRKRLVYNALDHYLPEELRDKVILKE